MSRHTTECRRERHPLDEVERPGPRRVHRPRLDTDSKVTSHPLHVAPEEPVNVAGFRAWADVYAVADEGLALASLLGTQTALEAIWAYLVTGERAVELADGARLFPMRPLLKTARGSEEPAERPVRYRRQTARLPESKAVHLVLVADLATLDGAESGWPAFLIAEGPTGDTERFWAVWNRICPLPALAGWAGWLWEAGRCRSLVVPLPAVHGCCTWRVDPDEAAWKDIIEGGLRDGAITG